PSCASHSSRTGIEITERMSRSMISAIRRGRRPPGWATLAAGGGGAIASPALWPATSIPGERLSGCPHFAHLALAPLLGHLHRGQAICQDWAIWAPPSLDPQPGS